MITDILDNLEVVMENIELGTQETWHGCLDARIRAGNCDLPITSLMDNHLMLSQKFTGN